MGLDLTLYKLSDFNAVEEERKAWSEDLELAYGRKTWGIANFFSHRCDPLYGSDYVFVVPEEVWDEFYNTMLPVAEKLEAYTSELYALENREIFSREEADEVQRRYSLLTDKTEEILSDALGESFFQLGADWEARAVLRWLDANEVIKQAYADGEKIVMTESY